MSAARRGVDYEEACELAEALPGVERSTSYGTPALKVRKKLIARLKEDGETLVVRVDHAERELLVQTRPETFFVTDHYRAHPWVLVRLARVSRGQLGDLLERAWRDRAPKRLVAEYDGRG